MPLQGGGFCEAGLIGCRPVILLVALRAGLMDL